MSKNLRISKFFGISESGPYLEVNEDLVSFDLENQFFSILDGFGGVGIGDKGVESIQKLILDFYLKVTEDKDSTMPFFYNFHYSIELNALINAITHGHRTTLKNNTDNKSKSLYGASGVFMVQNESTCILVSIGAMSCYLLRDDELFTIYDNDLTLKYLGHNISSSSSQIPYSALGLYYNLDYKVSEILLKKDDRLLIFTNGAIGNMDKDDFSSIVNDKDKGLKLTLKSLFDRSNDLGNRYNQSGIIIDY